MAYSQYYFQRQTRIRKRNPILREFLLFHTRVVAVVELRYLRPCIVQQMIQVDNISALTIDFHPHRIESKTNRLDNKFPMIRRHYFALGSKSSNRRTAPSTDLDTSSVGAEESSLANPSRNCLECWKGSRLGSELGFLEKRLDV